VQFNWPGQSPASGFNGGNRLSDIALNSDRDLDIQNGNLILLTAREAIRQHLSQRLKFWYGEWFLDDRLGMIDETNILTRGADPAIVDARIKSTILQTPGIVSIQDFSMDLDNATRKLSVSFVARSIDGDIDFSNLPLE